MPVQTYFRRSANWLQKTGTELLASWHGLVDQDRVKTFPNILHYRAICRIVQAAAESERFYDQADVAYECDAEWSLRQAAASGHRFVGTLPTLSTLPPSIIGFDNVVIEARLDREASLLKWLLEPSLGGIFDDPYVPVMMIYEAVILNRLSRRAASAALSEFFHADEGARFRARFRSRLLERDHRYKVGTRPVPVAQLSQFVRADWTWRVRLAKRLVVSMPDEVGGLGARDPYLETAMYDQQDSRRVA